MSEIWKDIPGYEGIYQISSLGRIKSLERKIKTSKGERIVKEKIKKLETNGKYILIKLCKNSIIEHVSIHRLVAQVFIPNPDNLPEVNHKDENKHNNSVDNLEWCTHKYNSIYGTAIERGHEKIRKKVYGINLISGYIHEFESISDTEKYGFNIKSISYTILKGKGKYKNHKWMFKNEQ